MSGHSHHHGASPVTVGEARRVRIVLAAIIVPIVLATLVGLALLWPGKGSLVGSRPFAVGGSSMETATVTSTSVSDCEDSAKVLSGISNGSLLTDALCAEITSGEGKGLVVPVHIPPESARVAHPGDSMKVLYTPQALAGGTPYVFVDYQRSLPIGLLAAVYLVLVLAVAGKRGALSVLGLLMATAVLMGFMIPALLAGENALAVTLTGSLAMMLMAVYVAHGVSVRTTTALLGTFAGVIITVLLALWGTSSSNLTGAVEDTALTLNGLVGEAGVQLDLRALLTCGMVVAGLGVLNDVTITQASAVWELHAANPAMPRGRLFTGGMRIGRDHIASTVYTLAFAYAGTALPLILSAALIDRSVIDTLLSGEIGEEIVRTLVSSIGLVLAIPATTAIATILCRTGGAGQSADGTKGLAGPGAAAPEGPAQPPETSDSASPSSSA
ncbi:YibE/F family protein [Actinomyces gaoshouyii]|uniref:YibE/F family protein n=1 Tax=Actinomyces gaoshouyii TaxID=1960083 RepID=UPI0009BDCD8B|nr:YibE/F family protein [Actinomyces gaoshouyii]ARD41818.1 hypothetical protein B6G06_05285 [Actinomyces gaoshouyii]